MSCIKKDIFQKYVDGEASPVEVAQIEKHIAVCENCAAKVDHQRKLVSGVKKTMNLLSDETVSIPTFVMPIESAEKSFFTVKRLVYLLASACILLFIVFIGQKKELENQAEIIMIEPAFAPEFDANLPVSQQQIVITIIDSKGNRTEFIE